MLRRWVDFHQLTRLTSSNFKHTHKCHKEWQSVGSTSTLDIRNSRNTTASKSSLRTVATRFSKSTWSRNSMDSLQSATTSFTSISSPSFQNSKVATLHSQHEDYSDQARKLKFLKIKFMTVEGESPRSSFIRPSNPILTYFYCLVISQTNSHCRFNQFPKTFQGFTILEFALTNPRTRKSEFRERKLRQKATYISQPK